jgi:hypothetical protein
MGGEMNRFHPKINETLYFFTCLVCLVSDILAHVGVQSVTVFRYRCLKFRNGLPS